MSDLEYILNEKNKYITKEYIEGLLKKHGGIDINIKNLEHFQRAMIHLSYLVRNEKFYKNNKTKAYQIQSNDIEPIKPELISRTIPLQEDSYERLEFLGDAQLHLIFGEYLFKRYEKEDEGFLTKLRTKIENGDTLSVLSETIGLGEYVVISRYVELNGGRTSNRPLLEDAFEAFIGALYLECGFEITKTFVVNLVEQEIDFAIMLSTVTNFKEKLLQYFHLKRWCDPVYGTLNISGNECSKLYTIYLKLKKNELDDGEVVATGSASSKKQAEQNAAKAFLISQRIFKEDDDEVEDIEEVSEDEGFDNRTKVNRVFDKEEEEDIEEITDESEEIKVAEPVNNVDKEDSIEVVTTESEKEEEVVKPKTFICPSCKKIYMKEHMYIKHISQRKCSKEKNMKKELKDLIKV
ncbi:MAG: ribonuclease III [Barrevirus sp.]|uniref:Ribonuclease III n=1 Tax=Barrevirus sp. TaxID=2487763 RepID=A0A3G4ZPV7_9VIRU|nr:MAG: ribonuclease III [Barrevirus sp.]